MLHNYKSLRFYVTVITLTVRTHEIGRCLLMHISLPGFGEVPHVTLLHCPHLPVSYSVM